MAGKPVASAFSRSSCWSSCMPAHSADWPTRYAWAPSTVSPTRSSSRSSLAASSASSRLPSNTSGTTNGLPVAVTSPGSATPSTAATASWTRPTAARRLGPLEHDSERLRARALEAIDLLLDRHRAGPRDLEAPAREVLWSGAPRTAATPAARLPREPGRACGAGGRIPTAGPWPSAWVNQYWTLRAASNRNARWRPPSNPRCTTSRPRTARRSGSRTTRRVPRVRSSSRPATATRRASSRSTPCPRASPSTWASTATTCGCSTTARAPTCPPAPRSSRSTTSRCATGRRRSPTCAARPAPSRSRRSPTASAA